jgi:hypothetical protein
MLLEGVIKLKDTVAGSPSVGDPIYLESSASARATATAPTGSGEYVRVLGYMVDTTNNLVYFSPDKTWIEIS